MDSKKCTSLCNIRKGIRNIIFDFLDSKDLDSLKTIILNSELTKHYAIKTAPLMKLDITKLDINLNSSFKFQRPFCCLSLFPEHPDSIVYSKVNKLVIEDLAKKSILEIKLSKFKDEIRNIQLIRLKSSCEVISCIFVLDQSPTLHVIKAKDFTMLHSFQLKAGHSNNFEVFQNTNDSDYDSFDAIISGLNGLTKYSGSLESNKLVRTYGFRTNCITCFSVINGLIFCGNEENELIVLDYRDLSIVSKITQTDTFNKSCIRAFEKLSFQYNTIAVGTDEYLNSIVIIDYAYYQKNKNEFTWKVLKTISTGSVTSLKYLRFKMRNYLIAGIAQDYLSKLLIIDLKDYQIIYSFSLRVMWINNLTHENILIATGNTGIHFFQLKAILNI